MDSLCLFYSTTGLDFSSPFVHEGCIDFFILSLPSVSMFPKYSTDIGPVADPDP